MYEILLILLGYLYGSIPFALVIGKVFYNTDVRESGSGNLGGTNAGRVLGKKAGISVIVLDALKAVIIFYLSSYLSLKFNLNPDIKYIAGLACIFGHCYPIFAHFKGGKAVTTMFGFLISTSIFIFQEFSYFLVPLFMFLIILYLFKYVSLGSICASVCSSLYITAQLLSLDVNNLFIILASWLMTLLVIYRHSANIKRIQEGTENKVSWL